ncbi:MAG: glutamate--tRNA ligase [Peptococcaceae bacterium]|jgi:glutamyl-tRNA synthetase|nr:glutamate--tRNA ligase [Peptococcaceae bacterium]
MSSIRVRFAPSPTGSLHIGGARTALFNWLFARKYGGSFVLRLEDTDLDRNLADAEKHILEGLAWLGLDWDEGPDKGGPHAPYKQSGRLDLYREEAGRLLGMGLAYPCYCQPDELARDRKLAQAEGRPPLYCGRCRDLDEKARSEKEARGLKPALRLLVPPGQTVVDDLIRGPVVFLHETIDDFIIVKSNGVPTYHLACVVDDHHMRISHVIRAEEHLSNTPKQLMLYRALSWEPPAFMHVSMILAPDRAKLSKRHGATGVEEFRTQGFLSEALLNYLALLGWSPGDEREVFSREELVAAFTPGSITKHAAVYDLQKLTWLCAQYLRTLPLDEVVERALPFLTGAGLVPADPGPEEMVYISRVVDLVRTRVHTLVELAGAADYFFRDEFSYEEKGVRKYFQKPGAAELLRQGREALAAAQPFDVAGTEEAYRKLIAELNISGGALIHPTRLALTGRTMGPGLFDIVAALGRERCLARLGRAAQGAE